ncbi:MAG: T9SS type A sorting domain-containing protein [Ignavibacteriales bacterium]|nr:T9SS type A sorting domain-containing protein [Ignavibacteriales bacterium]
MHRFLLFLTLLQILFFNLNLIGQNSPNFIRIDPPIFAPVNQNFYSSIIFKIDEKQQKIVNIKFNKPKSVSISSAYIRLNNAKKILNLTTGKFNRNEININLNIEELKLAKNVPYQIILECNSSKSFQTKKQAFFSIIENPKNNSNNYAKISDDGNDYDAQIYNIQKTAGNSIKLLNESGIKLAFNDFTNWSNLYTEFWLKSKNIINDFFVIEKQISGDTLLSISKNEFGFISLPIKENELKRIDSYIGENSWNYVGIMVEKDISNVGIKIFVNSELIYSFVSDNNFALDNLNFLMNNNNENSAFAIDRLKIWEFGNNIELANKNKHFISYDADSSRLIYQNNFDEEMQLNFELPNKKLKIESKNISYQNSDAPIFSKAPKLTVTLGSSYNSIVWYVQEYSVAKEFEIERSISNGEYEVVFKTLADDDPLKIYYFTDELISENEVAYYRVRQINRDGSEVYSPEVKIGNKEIQEFNLSQNYPNPFNPVTSIYVEVIIPTEFRVNVYDLVGNKVAMLYHGYLAEGLHTFEFDGSSLPSGIYFYEVNSPKSQIVKKMILAK